MARRSSVTGLPKAVREWLDKALVESGSGGYTELAEALQAKGYTISRSALGRYGKTFAQKIERMKLATEQARAVAEAVPDEEDALGSALGRVLQTNLLDFWMKVDEIDPESVDIAKLVAATAALNKAGIVQKQHEAKVRARVAKAAEEVAETATAAGLSKETVAAIKAKILGVAA